MNQQENAASEVSQEDRSFASAETVPNTSTGTLTEHDLPEIFQKKCFIKYFSAEWVDASDDIDHENATTIEANNRVAFKIQEYTEQELTNIELRIAFREHFACWGDKSFKLLSNPVKTELREFLLKREVDIEKGLGIHIVNALLKVVRTQTKEEEEWIQAVRQTVKERQRAYIESIRSPTPISTQQKGKQPAHSLVTQRAQETTTPEGEPRVEYLSRRNVQISPVDVSMADASYRQLSTQDVQMIDAPIPLRTNASANITHPAIGVSEDIDVTMISAPELPKQVQQSPVRYYGGTEYRDPPPAISSSSAIESPRQSGLVDQNDDSIWADDRVYQKQAGSQHPLRYTNLGQTHQQQAGTGQLLRSPKLIVKPHGNRIDEIVKPHGNRIDEIDETNGTRIDEANNLQDQVVRIEGTSNIQDRIEHHHTNPVKHHGMLKGAREIQMPIRTVPRTTRQTRIPAQEVRFNDLHDNRLIQDETGQVHRQNQMDEVKRQRVYKENIGPLNAAQLDYQDMNTPIMTDSEVRRIIMEIKRSVTTEEKYAGKNFASSEFRHLARLMAINIDEVPVEAHHSIGKIERYHGPLRRAYDIINSEVGNVLTPQQRLQLAVKAVNDSAGPDGLVPTLLVFGAYPRMSNDSPPSLSVVERAEVLRKATNEARRALASRQVREALATRNGPDTTPLHEIPLQSEVRVFRETGKWQGPFKLIAFNGETCTVEMPNGPVNFRSTVVKPYIRDPEDNNDEEKGSENDDETEDDSDGEADEDFCPSPPPSPTLPQVTQAPQKRGRGRPRKHPRPEDAVVGPDTPLSPHVPQPQEPKKRGRGRPRKHPLPEHAVALIQALEMMVPVCFITEKEKADFQLAIELRKEGKIKTPGAPFEASDKAEIDALIANGVFRFIQFDPVEHKGVRIFRSRMVRELKGKGTDQPYEKSRLVVQGHSDDGKLTILTQAPTIQRTSQRLIIALTPTMILMGWILWGRDITQAYPQSQTKLQRLILVEVPPQIAHLFPPGTLMVVIRPLYGVPESGTHWYGTYSTHHREKLRMTTSTYDPCLLITEKDNDCSGIIGMQTDDTLGLSDNTFSEREETELRKANLVAKPKQILSSKLPLIFNGCILVMNEDGTVKIKQKEQGKKLALIECKNEEKRRKQYVEQRARGAYIATICQPEAAFDLSVAAQVQDPNEEDAKKLNRRLKWQMENMDRGLRYIPLDLKTAALYVFVDGSFANNSDFTSQLGYVVIIGNETRCQDESNFVLKGNIITYSSTKSKRVTRSALASELYGMVQGADIAYAIGTTLEKITSQIGMPNIPTIMCTDSFSLYECLVKLGTTKEKRLMIDIMALRQSYERREIFEIRWINGADNVADAMTKTAPNKALERFVDTNEVEVRMEGWVARP